MSQPASAIDGGADHHGAVYTVAFKGHSGALAEAAAIELLGHRGVTCIGFPTFEDAFSAASARCTDFLIVPIETSLGGSVHANYDLLLQHSLFIIAEHRLRPTLCLAALPGTPRADLRRIASDPHTLAQCDAYTKRSGLATEATQDVEGSAAKLIAERGLQGVAAICSEHAAAHAGLEVLERGVGDDNDSFTRFLLLGRTPARLAPNVRCKTSVVFSMEDAAGALCKALTVFAMRSIDLEKVESRSCKPDVVETLQRTGLAFGTGMFSRQRAAASDPRPKRARTQKAECRDLFYVDLRGSVDEPNVFNALQQLQEMAFFLRVLGSFPRSGELKGLEVLGVTSRPSPCTALAVARRPRVGILGFGMFGQFLAKKMQSSFALFATSREDYSQVCGDLGVTWCSSLGDLLRQRLDVLILSTSIVSFESMARRVATTMSELRSEVPGCDSLLVVDVCSVKVHAKTTMLALLPESCDILCTHPMFGPESGKHSWAGLAFVYDRVRCRDAARCEEFLCWWSEQKCRMVDMSCEVHDELAAGSQFVTHFVGRMLERMQLQGTPINTKGFESLLKLTENTCKDSFDLFYALYKFNPNAAQQLTAMQRALADVSAVLQQQTPAA